MFSSKDPYTLTSYRNLTKGGVIVGILATRYEAHVFNDVQLSAALSPQKPVNQQFKVTCTQRICITGSLGPPPIYDSTSAAPNITDVNYPVILKAFMLLEQSDVVTLELLEYSPQTVNASVQQSQSGGATNATNTSTSTTNGSSFSQSNTYGASASVSAQGLSVTVDASETSTREKSVSRTGETGASRSAEHSDAESMSVKEWGAYASFDYATNSPVWTFGQEFPWNALQSRTSGTTPEPTFTDWTADSRTNVQISQAMQANLFDGITLRQPSDLSTYGFNFVCKAIWRVYADSSVAQSTTITVDHPLYLYFADHFLIGTTPAVFMDAAGTQLQAEGAPDLNNAITFDLNLLALDPVGVNNDAAAMGFIPSRFIPTGAAGEDLPLNFKILSRTNDLMITDSTAYASGDFTGFSPGNNCLVVGWPHQQKPFELSLFFKVIDLVEEYTLNLKHWILEGEGGGGVKLTFTINGDTDNQLVRYVQELEGSGGENNMLSIALRDLDFSSINYHDFLVLGLNSITMKIEPANAYWTSQYQLRAVSVMKH
jgi:hypothetical protein